MKKNLKLFFTLFVLMLAPLFLSACNGGEEVLDTNDEKLKIMTSILPQLEFVERIGGDKVEVSVMIPPGFSPTTYDPSPAQLTGLQEAQIYFRIGHIAFEKTQMKRLQEINPDMKVVDTSAGIPLLELGEQKHDEDSNEDEHEEGDDPHIWLSPDLVKIQAEHIYNALVEARPEDEEYFASNYENFVEDLNELDLELQETFAPIRGKTILVFHPSFGYLADAYGFEQEAIEIEGKDPSPGQLKELIDEARTDEIKVIFVQQQFSTKSAEAVAREIDGVVVRIDPLAKDYFANLRNMSELIINNLQ